MAFSKKLQREANRRVSEAFHEREVASRTEKESNYISPKKERAKAMMRKGLLSRVEYLLKINKTFPIAVRQLHAATIRPENRVQKTSATESRGEHYTHRIWNRGVSVKHMKDGDKQKHECMIETSRMHYREMLGLPKEEPVIAKKLRRKFRAKTRPISGDHNGR